MAFDLQSCGRTHFCHFKPRSLWSFVTAAAGASRGSWSSRVWWAPGPGKKQEGTGRQGRRRQEGDPPARSAHAGGLEERASRGAPRGALHARPRSVGFARQENAKSRLNALQQDGHAQSPGRCRVGGGQPRGCCYAQPISMLRAKWSPFRFNVRQMVSAAFQKRVLLDLH